jgi:hypothetical protein
MKSATVTTAQVDNASFKMAQSPYCWDIYTYKIYISILDQTYKYVMSYPQHPYEKEIAYLLWFVEASGGCLVPCGSCCKISMN